MNKLKRILILGLIAILCFSVIPTTVAYADSQPFSITGSDGTAYTPVKTDIKYDPVGEIYPTLYCLWVPEDVEALTIRASDIYTTLQCACNKGGTSTTENGEIVLSLSTNNHTKRCLSTKLKNISGVGKYIDSSTDVTHLMLVKLYDDQATDISYILIQAGGTKLIADPQPFSITGSDGTAYTPVKTDIKYDPVGEIYPTLYCLWVPEDVEALTIRASDIYTTLQCACNKGGTSTTENGEIVLSLSTNNHTKRCLSTKLKNISGVGKYIDSSTDVTHLMLVKLYDDQATDISYILIQAGGSVPTEDTTPPELSLVADGVQRTGETTATVKFTSSEAGTAYYSLVSADAVDTSAAGTAMVSGENTLNITGLTADAATVYIKAKDSSGNISVSTLEAAVPAYETTYEIYLGLWSHAQYYDLGYRVASVTADGRPLSMSGISEVECSGVKAGQTVKVTLYIPEAGKELASVSLITNDGNKTPINVTVDGTENSFTFTMPAANVRTAIGERFTLKDSSIVRYSLKSGVSLLYSNVGDIESNRQGTVIFTDSNGVTLMQAQPGQQVTVTAQPVPYTAGDVFHREFVCWKDIEGIKVSAEDQLKPSFTFEMPANDVYLFAEINNVGTEVTWKTNPLDVTNVQLKGLSSNDSPFVFADGATLSAIPLGEDWWYRYEFTGWTVERDGTTLPDSEVSTSLVNSSRPKGSFGYATKVEFKASGKKMAVTANFLERAFASVTAAADAAMGSATVTVGENTGTSQYPVYEGQSVILTAAPGARYTLTGWEVKDTDGTEIAVTPVEGNANQATFTMPATGKNISAKAIFEVDPDKASPACVLEDMELAIPSATVENTGTSYTITVPANTDADTLAAAVLKFTVSKYADVVTADGSVWPEDGKACGMTLDTPVTFTVRSEKCRIGKDDNAKADYTITVIRAKSTQCAIGSAKLGNVDGVVDQTGKTLTFTVPADTEDSAVTNMPLTFACSQYASIKLKDAEADWVNDTACGMKLNEEKTFVVTAEDGTTTAVYTVVIHRAPSDKKALTGATLGDIVAVIDEDGHALTFTVPADTTDSKLGEMILKFTCSPRATVKLKDADNNWPDSGEACRLKLGVPATFVVTAEDTSTREYTVTVNREQSTENAITEAVLTKTDGTSVKADISEQNRTITFTLPVGTTDADVAAMTLKFTCSQYASIKLEGAETNWPADGQLCGMKLNEAKTFVVTAENGGTQKYPVLIVRGKSAAKEITSAILLAKAGDTTSPATVKIDNAKKTIDFTLPAGSDTSKLGEMILKLTVSDYATVKKSGDTDNWPAAGKACGMELNKAATFTVTAENGSTQDYTVTITRTKSTTKDITAVKLLNADKSVIAEGKLSGTTWTITLPSDTDKALINKIGTSTDVFMQINYTGVSLAQAEGYDDATGTIGKWSSGNVMCGISPNSSKTFTVTAEDGSTKTYTVEIKYTAPNAPTLSGGSATRSSKTAATVKFTSSEAGNYFYKVEDHGAAVPTVDTSKNGTSAVKGENTITLSNLTEDARDIYIVVVNASRGESAALKVEIPAYGSGSETPDTGKFTITINAPKGGTITTNRTKADKGDEIIVTVKPDSGYQMVEGSLTYSLAVAGGETVKITGNRFTMPAGNVTITCKWETATTTAKGITSFSIGGVVGAVNNTTNTITITLPRGTDVTKLTPVIATNGVKSLTPGSGETVDFTNAVTYTAAMEDGSSKTYTVTVYVDKGTLADQFWDKLTDFATQVPWWEYAKHQQSTSKYPKYW